MQDAIFQIYEYLCIGKHGCQANLDASANHFPEP